MRSYLQILGVGEGKRGAPSAPRGAPAATPTPPRGRHVTEHERAQLRRLPNPTPVARLDGSVPPEALPPEEYALAMAGGAERVEGAPFSGEPPMSIRSAARPVIALSAYTPPSGGARDPRSGEPI